MSSSEDIWGPPHGTRSLTKEDAKDIARNITRAIDHLASDINRQHHHLSSISTSVSNTSTTIHNLKIQLAREAAKQTSHLNQLRLGQLLPGPNVLNGTESRTAYVEWKTKLKYKMGTMRDLDTDTRWAFLFSRITGRAFEAVDRIVRNFERGRLLLREEHYYMALDDLFVGLVEVRKTRWEMAEKEGGEDGGKKVAKETERESAKDNEKEGTKETEKKGAERYLLLNQP